LSQASQLNSSAWIQLLNSTWHFFKKISTQLNTFQVEYLTRTWIFNSTWLVYSNVYDLSYVVNWTIILDDREILHDSDTRVFDHANEFDFELWCNNQSYLIFNWCINWNYMHFSLCNQTIVCYFNQLIEMIKTLKKRNDWRNLKNILFYLQNNNKREFIIELISSWTCKDLSNYITNDETSFKLKVSKKDRKIWMSRNEILIIILSCFFCISTNWLLLFRSATSLVQSV